MGPEDKGFKGKTMKNGKGDEYRQHKVSGHSVFNRWFA